MQHIEVSDFVAGMGISHWITGSYSLSYFLRSWKSQKSQAVNDVLYKTELSLAKRFQSLYETLSDSKKYQFLKYHLSQKKPNHHKSSISYTISIRSYEIYLRISKQLLVNLLSKQTVYLFQKGFL